MDSLSTINIPFDAAELPRLEVPDEVRKALSALALAVNHGLEDEQLKVTAYALNDIPVPLLRRACLALAKTARFWPRPVEIRECVTAIQQHDADARDRRYLPPAAGEETFSCAKCRDDKQGWIVPVRCPEIACDRRKEHAPHFHTTRCPCWLDRRAGKLDLAKQKAIQQDKPVPFDCRLLDELRTGTYRWAKPMELWR